MNKSSIESNSRPIQIQRAVDKLCDDIELQWSKHESVDVAGIVANLEPDMLPSFFREILQLELEVRGREFNAVCDEYFKLFPQHIELLKRILDRIAEQPTRLMMDPETVEPPDFVGKTIGDYFVEKKLGGGGFGDVYLGRDEFLPRKVVIKIPILGKNGRKTDTDFFLNEARNAALLQHSNILRVLHVGIDSGMPYIVQEFFEGGDLQQALNERPFSISHTIDFVSKVASTIGHAHKSQIVHRDLKPANILINKEGDPVIADFGLSLYEPQLRGKKGEMVGTIRFMSPEQVRGEAHRLDGRTDIWSIGVILYLMLVGRYPFNGSDVKQIGESILFGQPVPPRQLNDDVSPELERICLKCLAVRVNERYTNAFDLADDLQNLMNGVETPETKKAPTENPQPGNDDVASAPEQKLIPKGLAAFDSQDQDFFLDLLPGPKDRNGLPDSIRFWKDRIENPELSNPVNLLFGPSGCGKSSLVSAGLIPVLNDSMVVVSIESSPQDTEVRWLKALRSQIPSIPDDLSLPDLIAEIRRGVYLPPNKRLLIVFDQFEQWLHANSIDEHSQLIHALRQCDGDRIQALILAREDFWMAITRFFKQLEIELVERQNFASVDLFNRRHAKEVLTKYGQAFGSLPVDSKDISKSEDMFLDQAVDLLAEKDSVICVRSALFAETVKNKSWELDTIQQIGDSKNIGVAFLDQAIGEQASNPKYRYYREPIIAVLEALLPDPGIEIKGNLKSTQELSEAVDMGVDGSEFKKVIHILDRELRLITPTEPDAGRNQPQRSGDSYYQLTHDYLVPSLRDWINSFRRKTRAGRARQRLESLTAAWQQNSESRFLPGFFEYGSILLNVPSSSWHGASRELMRNANRYYGIRVLLVSAVFAIVSNSLWQSIQNRKANQWTQASQLVICDSDLLLDTIDSITNRIGTIELIETQISRKIPDRRKRIMVCLAMLKEKPDFEINYIVNNLKEFDAAECKNVFTALNRDPDHSLERIENKLDTGKIDDDLKARLHIMQMFLEPAELDPEVFEYTEDLTYRSTVIDHFKSWHGDLSLVVDMIQNSENNETLAGVLLCVGLLDEGLYLPDTYDKLVKSVLDLFKTSSSSCVHGSAEFALRRWGEDTDLPKCNPTEKEWFITNKKLTMVSVKAGEVPSAESKSKKLVDDDYFISSTEIVGGIFKQFLVEEEIHDRDYWTRERIDEINEDLPISTVNLDDAIQFCNWLSTESDLNLEPCYKFDEDNKHWALVDKAVGYRLPTHDEWELAARGGSILSGGCSEDYPFAYKLADNYVWFQSNSLDGTTLSFHSPGMKMPNRLGLFDVLGNVEEICNGKERASLDPGHFYGRGGSAAHGLYECKLVDTGLPAFPEIREGYGFRVVLNIKR